MLFEHTPASQAVAIVEQLVDPLLNRLPSVVERILLRQLVVIEREMVHAAKSNPKSCPVCCVSIRRASAMGVEAVAVSRWRGFSRRKDLSAMIEHVHLQGRRPAITTP
jgi:hypothetical protein